MAGYHIRQTGKGQRLQPFLFYSHLHLDAQIQMLGESLQETKKVPRVNIELRMNSLAKLRK